MQPFHLGPRECIGKKLAYVLMRLGLARFLWNFELRFCNEQERWENQKSFQIWYKQPLMCKIVETRAKAGVSG